MLAAGKSALHRPELRDAKLPGEFRVERNLRASGVDEESDLVAPVHAHADQRQRICPQELQTRTLPVAMHLIGRLALEAPQLRNIQCRILRDDQPIGTHVDAVQRSRRLFEIVAAIIHLGEHDLGVGVTGPQGDGPFQPILGIVKAVGKQRDPTQLENCRIVVGGVGGDTGILFASLGKLPDLEEPIGGIDWRWLLLRRPVPEQAQARSSPKVRGKLQQISSVRTLRAEGTARRAKRISQSMTPKSGLPVFGKDHAPPRRLVSRFRSSHHCAAHSFANFGIKGTLAIYEF